MGKKNKVSFGLNPLAGITGAPSPIADAVGKAYPKGILGAMMAGPQVIKQAADINVATPAIAPIANNTMAAQRAPVAGHGGIMGALMRRRFNQ